jgi:hypothetical protein
MRAALIEVLAAHGLAWPDALLADLEVLMQAPTAAVPVEQLQWAADQFAARGQSALAEAIEAAAAKAWLVELAGQMTTMET